jgi:predicted metal-dependent hydrolase
MADDSERPELGLGRAAFNRGEYFLAHELWEETWREMTDARQRRCVQGLIQIAAAFHHLQKRRIRPATGLLRKGLEKLSHCAPHLDLLAGQVTRLLGELEAPRPEVVAIPDLTQFRL